ncbi:MAG: bifunctional DNA primase/polymerase [Acidimicrobiales bacterium]
MTGTLEAALATAARGWRVFPLVAGRKTPRRQLTDWEAKATADPARVERWWTRHPADNIGIACGPSGLVVVDLDVAKPDDTPPHEWTHAAGGVEVLAELARRRGHELAATFTVETSSGGRHLYYRAPAGRELRNTAGRIGWRIDTRAHGGYVVAPGSLVHGQPYRVVDQTQPVGLPDWLVQLVNPPEVRPHFTARPVPRARGYVATVLRDEVQRVLDAPPGTRNHALNKATWNLARLVAQGVLPRDVVETALQTAGETARGQTPAGVAATIRAALDARLRRGARL